MKMQIRNIISFFLQLREVNNKHNNIVKIIVRLKSLMRFNGETIRWRAGVEIIVKV